LKNIAVICFSIVSAALKVQSAKRSGWITPPTGLGILEEDLINFSRRIG
jgi:hypothetical protein